ncbi:MAG: hypothetical protein IJZ22_03435 [Bacteroidaceae bacterium]|nr:hypothetical protein [Bacteroidaceae bacterium]
MKKVCFILALLMAGTYCAIAQTTALVVYEGGYFVKNDKTWEEYRPADKKGIWSSYKQWREDDTFFYLKNKKCQLTIPKVRKDKIFIARGKSKKWEIVYNTIDIHNMCPNKDGLFYCYQDGRGDWHNGYFVRNNASWIEYAPGKQRQVWAEFKQTGEDDNYFFIESTKNKVSVPKHPSRNFIITNLENDGWRGGYTTKAIYDRSAQYDYNFYFGNIVLKGKDTAKHARVSFDRSGNIQIACNDKHYDLEYRSMELVNYYGRKAVSITIDEKSTLLLAPDGKCYVNCKSVGKNMIFTAGDNGSNFAEVFTLLKNKSFYQYK